MRDSRQTTIDSTDHGVQDQAVEISEQNLASNDFQIIGEDPTDLEVVEKWLTVKYQKKKKNLGRWGPPKAAHGNVGEFPQNFGPSNVGLGGSTAKVTSVNKKKRKVELLGASKVTGAKS